MTINRWYRALRSTTVYHPSRLRRELMNRNETTIRAADLADVNAIARIRAAEWGTEEYWTKRVSGYMRGEIHPQHALPPRVLFVATEGKTVIGLIAGHLTRRYGCDGELEWIDVVRDQRGKGVATHLLRTLAAWFCEHQAKRICVDVEPANHVARSFYKRHGAEELNAHWLVWGDITTVTA